MPKVTQANLLVCVIPAFFAGLKRDDHNEIHAATSLNPILHLRTIG